MKRYWMMDSEYEWVEVSEPEHLEERKSSGEALINNSIVATIYPDSILWDIKVGNIHGSDVATINSIVAQVEREVGHA